MSIKYVFYKNNPIYHFKDNIKNRAKFNFTKREGMKAFNTFQKC